MNIDELIEFEKEWLDEAGYTKQNVLIVLCSIKATVKENEKRMVNDNEDK